VAEKRRGEAIDDGLLCGDPAGGCQRSVGRTLRESTPTRRRAFGTLLKTEVERWGKVVRESGITVQ